MDKKEEVVSVTVEEGERRSGGDASSSAFCFLDFLRGRWCGFVS
jgi:hypothetical protein